MIWIDHGERPSLKNLAFHRVSIYIMASVKKGILTESPQWWKHLKDWKRVFWHKERKASKKEIKSELV